MEVARKLTGFIGKGPWGWKSLWLLTFFWWEKALPPLCCSQQLEFITAVHGRLDKPESLWSSGRDGDNRAKALGDKQQVLSSLSSLSASLFAAIHLQTAPPPWHNIIASSGLRRREKPIQHEPKMKETKKFPWEWLLFPLLLPHQAIITSTGKHTQHFLESS